MDAIMKESNSSPFRITRAQMGITPIGVPNYLSPVKQNTFNSTKENEHPNIEDFDVPTTPVQSSPQRKKRENQSTWSIKSKRMKKLADQLPDLGGVDDILKMQEELNEYRERTKILEERNSAMQRKMETLEKERKCIEEENSKLSDEMKVQGTRKEILMNELSEKVRQFSSSEEQRNSVLLQLQQQKEKVDCLEKDKAELEKRISVLESVLKESGVELQVTKLQHKQLSASYQIIQQKESELLKELEETNEEKTKLETLVEQLQEQQQDMENEIYELRREFFLFAALAIKLNLTTFDKQQLLGTKNLDNHKLFEKVLEEEIPIHEWPKWINQQFLKKP